VSKYYYNIIIRQQEDGMKLSFSIFTGLFLALAVCFTGAFAQENAPKMIRGGVLNGKAISLPKPLYPEEAKKDRAEGPVSVTVTIDEEGNVIEAKAAAEYKVAGAVNDNGEPEMKPIHPALREAAESAARAAKFSPTKLSGRPVKVTGTIVYNFLAGGPISESPSNGNPTREIPKQVSGGILNGRARSLPKPEYPETAKAAGVSGAVSVKILVDEGGNVISAEAVAGHPLLRAAAVDAALQAQFAPTRLSGQPVKVSGIVTYNFVLPPKDN
jgi:TonB family protein